MIKALMLPAVLLAGAGTVHAAEGAPSATTANTTTASPAKLALAEKVLVAMRTEENLKSTLVIVQKSMSGMTRSMLGDQADKVTAEELAAMDKGQALAIGIVQKELSWNALKKEFIQLYAETYTEPELKAMYAFYSSPEGVSILEKTPVATARSLQIVQARMVTIMPKVQAEIKKSMEAAHTATPDDHGHSHTGHDHGHQH